MEDMRLKKFPRSATRLAVRLRRLARRAGVARRGDGFGAILKRSGGLAVLLGAIVLGSYMASRPETGESPGPFAYRPTTEPASPTAAPAVVAAAPTEVPAEPRTVDRAPVDASETLPAIVPESETPAPANKVAAASPAAVDVPAAETPLPMPSFRDQRSLQDSPEPSGVLTSTAVAAAPVKTLHDPRIDDPGVEATRPALDFRDDRPLAKPAFQDQRPVAAPSFRDLRPTAPGLFRDARPVSPGVTTGPAAEPDPEEANKLEPKPFEVGYYLADRSPMVRAMEDEPADEVKASMAKAEAAAADSAKSGASEPAAGAAATPTPSAATSPAAGVAAAAVAAESAPAADGALPTLVALAPGSLKIEPTACNAPEVATEALEGGLMRMRITANCRGNEFVQISYGGAEFIRKLSTHGALDFTLDAFAGTASAVEVRFADGNTKSVPVVAKDLDKVSKIAVLWRTGVNLDLHVFEYAAKLEQAGHLWARTPSAMISAKVQAQAHGRGHGFLSSVDDDKSLGDKLEVYTFFHNDQQSAGAISLALDNETRGESPSGATCGQGALAEIDFQVAILPRNGQVSRQSGVLTRVDCGTRLTADARFNQAAMPGLRIRK